MSAPAPNVSFHEADSIRVGAFLRGLGFDLCSSTGIAFTHLTQRSEIGILRPLNGNTSIKRLLWFTWSKRRSFIGTVWVDNEARQASSHH